MNCLWLRESIKDYQSGRIIDKFPTCINDNTALLTCPFYFCVDNWNNILITDKEQIILRIVSRDGKVLVNVNTKDEWGLILPRGIATTRDGRVLIVFGGEHRPCFAVFTMALANASKLLDELMGQNRDGEDGDNDIDFKDFRMCRPFLFGLCPNEMFLNTKLDLGDCTKIHSIGCKVEFEKTLATHDYGFEEEVVGQFENIIASVEDKIKKARQNLEDQEETEEAEQKAQKIHYLAAQIGEKVALAEDFGGRGQVEKSLELMKEVDEIKSAKQALEVEYRSSVPMSAQQAQKLRVCDVCSAYLSLYDNDRRLADHFGGKLHMGFVSLREKLKELKTMIESKANEAKRRIWVNTNYGYRYSERSVAMPRSRTRSTSRDRKYERRSRSKSDNSQGREDWRRRDKDSSRKRRHHRDGKNDSGHRSKKDKYSGDEKRSRDDRSRSSSSDRRKRRNERKKDSRYSHRDRDRRHSRSRSRSNSYSRSRHSKSSSRSPNEKSKHSNRNSDKEK